MTKNITYTPVFGGVPVAHTIKNKKKYRLENKFQNYSILKLLCNKMKNKNHHTIGTISKSKRKNRRKRKHTQIHDSLTGTDTSM